MRAKMLDILTDNILQSFAPTQVTALRIRRRTYVYGERCILTEERIAGRPGGPSRLPSNGGKKFRGHLAGVDPCHCIPSARIIVCDHIGVAVSMVPNKISNPIWETGFVHRLAGECDP